MPDMIIVPAKIDLMQDPEDDDADPRFRLVFAAVDPDDLAGSLATCYGCAQAGLIYASAFEAGSPAPLQVGHWSDMDTIPFAAGRVEIDGDVAALIASPAQTPGAREDAGRLQNLIDLGIAECSARLTYDEIRVGDELTEAERLAGADFALVRSTLIHVAIVQSGAVPRNSVSNYAACGHVADSKTSADNDTHRPRSACADAEAKAEVALIRGDL